jgi:hypothetical protein
MGKKAYRPKPTAIPHADEQDIRAFRAMMAGNANDGQQRRVLTWLVNASGYYETSFRDGYDGQRLTDFAEGKRFMGGLIVSMTKAIVPSEVEQPRKA